MLICFVEQFSADKIGTKVSKRASLIYTVQAAQVVLVYTISDLLVIALLFIECMP